MDSPEQRRKRNRLPKTTKPSPFHHFPSVRSLIYCSAFFISLYLLFRQHTVSFHHGGAGIFSNYQIGSGSVFSKFQDLPLFKFKIEDRVLFPDHTLLLASVSTKFPSSPRVWNGLQCVYKTNNSNPQVKNVLSVDEYKDNRLIIRCPQLQANFSHPIAVQSRGVTIDVEEAKDEAINSWENLAYEAVFDGSTNTNTNTAVVFVKGISHRQGKESDPTRFACHFGLGKYMITSRAVTVAQEVVRCVLPTSMVRHPDKGRGLRATVSYRMPRAHGRENRVVVPSVAKISSLKPSGEVVKLFKHELCVCTMLWNQAESIREWIMYHSWLGVEKWFVYDNNSDDGIETVIESLDREGYNVSRHVWPWIKTQEAGFSHCAIRARTECHWVSFMDVDEFYYFPYNPVSGFPTQGSLRTLVSNFTTSSSIGEIRTSCHSFGPSGLTSRPKRGVMVGYTCRLQSPERHKSIIRPDALDTTLMNVVHHFHLRKGFTYMDLPHSIAVINHYKYQVWDVFRVKFHRRVATYVADWTESQNEGSRDRAPGLGTEAIEPPEWRLQFCEVWDTGLRDFVLANFGDGSTGVLPWDRT